MDILNPPGWPRPKGYSNGIAVSGRMVFVAGMIGWNANEEFETDDFAGQFRGGNFPTRHFGRAAARIA